MPVVTPPSITALPTPPDPADRSTFNTRAYPWSVAQQTLATEVGAVATNVAANATDAATSATTAASAVSTASGHATTATTQAGIATTQAGIATTKAGEASSSASTASTHASTATTKASEANASAIAAAASAASISGGPVTSVNGMTGVVTGLATAASVDAKQDTLVSGTNIKTLNGSSLLGSGNVVISSPDTCTNAYNVVPVYTSGSFTAPVAGTYRITAVGGGGAGGCSLNVSDGAAATGGGAGGLCQKTATLTAGQVLTVVIGAGGVQSTNASQNGQSGTATTVTGTGISMTANGGEGGKYFAGKGTIAAGAAGGTATGGDANYTGGGSGSAFVYSGIAGASGAATGGGAVNVTGTAYASGLAEVKGTTVTGRCVTGGAGVGGSSQPASMSSGSDTQLCSSGGGFGPGAAAALVPGATSTGPTYQATPFAPYSAAGHGAGATDDAVGQWGCGGGACHNTSTQRAGHGITFAGGGGLVIGAPSANQTYGGGNGGIGAGGGGCAHRSAWTGSFRAGNGGNGIVIVEKL